MIRLAGTRASRAVRSTTRCHSASVSGGISGSTVVTAAVPMTTAAGRGAKGPGPAAPARAASPGGGAAWPGPVHAAGPGPRQQQRRSAAAAARGWPGACSAPGPIGDGDSSLTARTRALEGSEEQLLDTVLHEIAHAIAGHEAGHGLLWKATARRIGATPRGEDL